MPEALSPFSRREPARNPYDQFDEPANPYNQFDTDEERREREGRVKWGAENVSGMAARGALDQGVGSMAEGALRGADAAVRGARAELETPDYQQAARILEKLRADEKAIGAGLRGPDPDLTGRIATAEARLAKFSPAARPKLEAIAADPGLKPATAKVGEFRQAVRDVYPVDDDVQRSIPGQVVSGVGQVAGSIPAYLSGLGIPAAAAQMFDQGFTDAVANGADEETALQSGIANLPAALLEQVGNKLQLGGLVKALRSGGSGGKQIIREGVKAMAGEAGTEALQQLHQNTVAKLMYDEGREVTEGVGEAALVGGLTGATVATGATALGEGLAKLDTGKNIPEAPETLAAQQEQLTAGRRKAQMFPVDERGEVANELPLPEGMERVENARGVFHYNPEFISGEQILAASAAGRENDVLAMGPVSKDDVARSGEEPLAITERSRNGTEIKTAVTMPSRAQETVEALNRTKTPGNEIAAEPLGKTLGERQAAPSFVGDLMQADAKRALDAQQKKVREAFERDQRQRELAEKRKLFDQRVTVARETFAKPEATFAELNGALESVKFYAEDNSLGLTQEQRQTAAKAQNALTQRVESLRAIEDARKNAEAERLKAQAELEKASAIAQRRAEKQDFKKEVAAGIAADGSLDYDRLPEERLVELAQAGDARAEKVLMRSNDGSDDRPKLLDVLKSVKLPASDETLPGELRLLIAEGMTDKQRRELVGKQSGSLDGVANALRADHGFSFIKTPADVIDAVQRALRGEDVRADGGVSSQVEFAKSSAGGLDPGAPRSFVFGDAESSPRFSEDLREARAFEVAINRQASGEGAASVSLTPRKISGGAYAGSEASDLGVLIERLFGKRIIFVEPSKPVLWSAVSFPRRANTILINTQSPAPFLALVGHELGHNIKAQAPDLYREMEALINEAAPMPESYPAEKRAQGYTALQVKDEWVNDVLGARFDEPTFWQELGRAAERRGPESMAVFRTVVTKVRRWLRELGERVRQMLQPSAADPMLRDLARVERTLADILVQYQSRGKLPDDPVVAKFSKGADSDLSMAIVPSLPKVDRKAALMAELKRGRELSREGNGSGNDAALAEGVRLTKLATERLDDEYPGWDAPAPPAEVEAAPTDQPLPEDQEATAFNPGEEETMPVRAGQFDEVYGQGSFNPGVLEKSWAKVRDVFAGIRGSIPELPAFPEASWNRADSFIRTQGGAFYNRLKEGFRALRSGNDHVQRTAEEQVSRVIRPLIAAGAPFDANDYAKLRRRQEQARRLRAENKPVPKGVAAEISALNSKLESSPYVLFNRLVLALDLNWRQQNLKDSEGNPIKLPANVNAAEVSAELQRLGNKIEANPHAQKIKAAVQEHMELVRQAAVELKDRELLAAEHLENPYYFPHLTLEINKGDKVGQRELTPSRVKPGTEADFRGYLIDPVGSSKAIETDYLRAMYYHLVQVGAHNFKADVVRDFFRPYDVKQEVEATAKKLGKERGVPVSWEQAWHEVYEPQGYVLYGTDSRDAFPAITVNRDALARRLGVMLTSEDLHAQLKRLGLNGVKLLPEDLRETLDMSARETWVVPARVAEALRGIAEREAADPGAIDAAMKFALGKWKAWKLFMPWNHVRYEYGNMVADVEKLLSADPRTFKFMGAAAKEVRDFWRGGVPGDDLRAAVKEGVINAITAQEMNQLQRLPGFDAFQTTAEKAWGQVKRRSSSAVYQPVSNFLGMGDFSSVEMSAFREAVFRYAKFKADLDALRNGARPHYAGAYWKDIDAMEDSAKGAGDAAVRKAAAISKATFGNYGDLSVLGAALRDKLIPFYSWMEVNFKYHANLLRNLRDMVRAGEASQAEAMKAGGRAAAVFAAGFTARAAGGIALRLALPYVAMAIWNATGGRDELEELLSDEDRRRFHIILGETKDGNSTLKDGRKIEVVYGNTALMDVMKWFGGPAFVQQMAAWLNGKTDFKTAFSGWRDRLVPDFINNTVGSAGPFVKIPVALGLKKNTFPDVMDARNIPAYDLRRVVIGQMTDDFTADQIERVVNKDYYAAKDVGTWAKQLILQVRQRDPQAWAFYEIKDKAATFLEQRTGQKRDNSYDAPDQQVLRNFRRAIYRGDAENAAKFYLRLLDYGYTAERFAASIRAQDPLSALPKENGLRRQFVESLPPFDREQLDRAYEFYHRLSSGRGRERTLFPTQRSGARGQENFRASPRTDRLEAVMENSGAADEETVRERAQQDLRRSLQRRP